jgi:hypothetical protein
VDERDHPKIDDLDGSNLRDVTQTMTSGVVTPLYTANQTCDSADCTAAVEVYWFAMIVCAGRQSPRPSPENSSDLSSPTRPIHRALCRKRQWKWGERMAWASGKILSKSENKLCQRSRNHMNGHSYRNLAPGTGLDSFADYHCV